MLLNLTSVSFASYGTVPKDGFDKTVSDYGFDFIKQREVTDKVVARVFQNPDSVTVLDIFDGNAILFVGETPSGLKTFLLDKTVCIKPGIYYYIVPLLNSAKISTSSSKNTRIIPIDPQDRPQGLIAHINPSKIHTLFYQEKELNFSFKGEKHPFWELTYIDTGCMQNKINDTVLLTPAHSVLLFPPNQFHSQFACDNTPVRYLTITFDMDFPEPELFDSVLFTADESMIRLFQNLLREYREQLIYSDDLVLCYLKELIISMIRLQKIEHYLKSASSTARKVVENDLVYHAKEYIRKNITLPITVGEIARSIPVSETYLSTIFKRYEHQSLKRYINNSKLELAKKYIVTGKYSFTEISELLGYNNIHYFSTQFKKAYSMTPTEYADSILK